MEAIKENFDKLKQEYNGKKLINEIYKQSLGIDLKLDTFNLTQLIVNTKLSTIIPSSLYLNKTNRYYNMILNKYWSGMASSKYAYIKGGEEVNLYTLKVFRDYNDPERRQDFIYKETFKTGDILIYKNNNDYRYTVDTKNNQLIKEYITYEEGEYAYIYIENEGFIGVNLGDDGQKDTKDDRNEFNSKYYKENNLTLYQNIKDVSEWMMEVANYQTLFGKDYYVILRPSLFSDDFNN